MNYNEIFTKPEKPFLLIYENESNNYIEWLETKEELMERIEKN